jgi:hypothetical protein
MLEDFMIEDGRFQIEMTSDDGCRQGLRANCAGIGNLKSRI